MGPMRQQTWDTTDSDYIDRMSSARLIGVAENAAASEWAKRLDAIDELRRRLNGWEVDAIIDARDQATWQEIAERTGQGSRQAAHKHFTDLSASLDEQ